MLTTRAHRGFALIGVAVSLAVLAVMASGIAALVASNHSGRTTLQYSQQAYYVNQAAFEYAMNRIKVAGDSTVADRQFLSTSMGMSIAGGKIASTVVYPTSGGGGASFSINKPSSSLGPSCIYVLASSGSGMAALSGTNNLQMPTCGINVNSSNATAFTISGSAQLNTYFLKIVGGYSKTGTSTITTNSGVINTGATAVADPLLSYNMPTYSACNYNSFSLSGSGVATMSPGVYCGGISISGSKVVTMLPGNYIVDGGNFSTSGTAVVTGTGVTIFLNKQLGTTWPRLSLSGSGLRTFVAPTSGPYAGIAVFQSRSATSGTNTMSGSGTLNVTGAIYLPNQTLSFSGSSSSAGPCTMLVVNRLTVTGTATISCLSGYLSGLIN